MKSCLRHPLENVDSRANNHGVIILDGVTSAGASWGGGDALASMRLAMASATHPSPRGTALQLQGCIGPY